MWVNRSDEPWVPSEDLSRGPQSGFLENYGRAVDDQMVGRSMLALGFNFKEQDEKNVKLIQQLTGDKTFEALTPGEYDSIAGEIEDGQTQWVSEAFRQRYANQRERLIELKKQYPQIKTYDEVWQQTKAYAQQTQREYEDTQARADVWGKVGGLTGSMLGSMTYRDPLNVVTLGVGGVGKTIVVKAATEGAAQGAVEAVNQFTGVSRNRRLMGLDNSLGQQLTAVGGAVAGGVILRGGGELGAKGLDKLAELPAYKSLSASTRNVFDNMLGRQPGGGDPVEHVLDLTEHIESSGNPNAQSDTSSAAGAYGMTRRTFLNLVRRNNPELADLSDAQVLEKRFDRDFSRQKAKELHEENAGALKAAGLPVTPENLRVTYFLGAPDGIRTLKADPSTPMDQLVPGHAIDANEKLLKGKTAGEVVAHERGLMNQRPVSNADLVKAVDELKPELTPPQRGAVEHLRRQVEEDEVVPTVEQKQRVDAAEQALNDGTPVSKSVAAGDEPIQPQLNKIENSINDLLADRENPVKADEKIDVSEMSEPQVVQSGAASAQYRVAPGGEFRLDDFNYLGGRQARKDATDLMQQLTGTADRRGMTVTMEAPPKTLRGSNGQRRANPMRSFAEKHGFVEAVDANGKPTGTMVRQPAMAPQPAEARAPATETAEPAPPARDNAPATPQEVERTADAVKQSKLDAGKSLASTLKAKAKEKLSKAEAMLYAEPKVDEKGNVVLENRRPDDILAELEEDEQVLKAMKECSI